MIRSLKRRLKKIVLSIIISAIALLIIFFAVPAALCEYDTDLGFVSYENFVFELPKYWEEDESKKEYVQYYAEASDKVAMLSIGYPVDDEDTVSLDLLYSDNENMIKLIEDTFPKAKNITWQYYQNKNSVFGILYEFDFKIKPLITEYDAKGKMLCYPSVEDNRWFYVVLAVSEQTEKSYEFYEAEYMDMLNDIHLKTEEEQQKLKETELMFVSVEFWKETIIKNIWIVLIIVVCLIVSLIVWAYKSVCKEDEDKTPFSKPKKEKRRTDYVCRFNDAILSQDEFKIIVEEAFNSFKGMKKRARVTIDTWLVRGEVESLSGLSVWKFVLDFNDYGKITGNYWIYTENYESVIPKSLANVISDKIKSHIAAKK